MSSVVALEAQKREKVGTGAARATRRLECLPGVVYGPGKEPMPISLDAKVLGIELQDPAHLTKLYSLKIAGKEHKVIIRDVQYHPVTDRPVHVDMYFVSKGAKLHVFVPVHFINEEKSPGMKRGGVLNVIMHEMELNVPADNIPEYVTIDLDGLNIGDTVHLGDLNLPEGVEPTHPDRDFTIATVVAPSALKRSGALDDSEETSSETEEASGD